MKEADLEARLRRLERLSLYAVAQVEGVRIGVVDITALRGQARRDVADIVAEQDKPILETRVTS